MDVSPSPQTETHHCSIESTVRASSPLRAGLQSQDIPNINLSPIRNDPCLSPAGNECSLNDTTSDSIAFKDISTLSCIDNTSTETHESTIAFMDTTDPAIQNAFESQTTVRCGGSLSHLMDFTCCEHRCVASLSLVDIEQCRTSFKSRSRLNQQQFLLDIFTVSLSSKSNVAGAYTLLGRNLCKPAFKHVLGISDKRLRKIHRLHSSGFTIAIRAHRIYNKSEKYEVAKAWMKRYFDRIGDKMPHIQQTHLPHFLSKRTVYNFMSNELLQQGHTSKSILSLSHFYSLWAKEFSYCIIPKVS